MDELIGKVKVVIFHNEDNLYSVVKVKLSDEINKYVTITGNFPLLDKNFVYKFHGEFVDHPRFGKQFQLEKYERILPSSKEGIIKYLSSPIFPKIGVKTATLIVDYLGEDTLRKIREDASVLDGLIKPNLIEIIKKGLNEDSYFDEAVKLFVTQGLSIKMLVKIQAVYGEHMISVIRANPYKLVEDIDGIGFKTADDFAKSIGIEANDERRIKAAIVYSINYICMQEGDTYTNLETVKKYVKKIIKDIDEETIEEFINMLVKENRIINEKGRLYSLIQYESEVNNAKYLAKFIKRNILKIEKDEILDVIHKIEKKEEIVYDEDQINAIIKCLNSGISIITGGPGTGKTTIVKALIKVYKELLGEGKIFLSAPTGRASKRLSELTGEDATTIHRMLKWDLDSNRFSINEKNPLDGDLLIVDEFSMVDNFLLYNLLNATQQFSQIILIGDDDQLPSVGPGNVLSDLINSNLVSVIRLNKIYRQKEKSNIILLSHYIKNNKDIFDTLKDDVIFYSCDNQNIKNVLLEYIKVAKENGYQDDDIQVIAPMYMGVNGIDNLNDYLQEYFNPSNEVKNEFKIGRRIFRENDRILQLKNQNDDDVYNGDIGVLKEIVDVDDKVKLIVDFDGNMVTYSVKDLINITHAYCISIHKSQGSEYPLVIMPVSNEYRVMLAKNLIYTGVTRAKKKLIIIGNYSAFLYGINNTNYKIRNTRLKERLLNE